MPTICKSEGCNQPITSKETGLCHKHHLRFIRNGKTELSRHVVDKSKQCSVEGCCRKQQTSLNVCLMHYKRFKKYGTFKLPERTYKSEYKCKFCSKKIGRNGSIGMCNKHYQMWKIHGDPLYSEKNRIKPSRDGYYRDTDGEQFHRKVAEEIIGRKLIKGVEVVHHIDLDKLNNEPSNLVVLTKAEHASLHQQLNRIAGELVRAKIIKYKDGSYYKDI